MHPVCTGTLSKAAGFLHPSHPPPHIFHVGGKASLELCSSSPCTGLPPFGVSELLTSLVLFKGVRGRCHATFTPTLPPLRSAATAQQLRTKGREHILVMNSYSESTRPRRRYSLHLIYFSGAHGHTTAGPPQSLRGSRQRGRVIPCSAWLRLRSSAATPPPRSINIKGCPQRMPFLFGAPEGFWKSSFPFAEVGGRNACLAAEVATEGGLLVEA